jgi:hypothetical protein
MLLRQLFVVVTTRTTWNPAIGAGTHDPRIEVRAPAAWSHADEGRDELAAPEVHPATEHGQTRPPPTRARMKAVGEHPG